MKVPFSRFTNSADLIKRILSHNKREYDPDFELYFQEKGGQRRLVSNPSEESMPVVEGKYVIMKKTDENSDSGNDSDNSGDDFEPTPTLTSSFMRTSQSKPPRVGSSQSVPDSSVEELKKKLESTESELKSLREDYIALEKANDEESKRHQQYREDEAKRLAQLNRDMDSIKTDMKDVYDLIIKIGTPRSILDGWSVQLNEKLLEPKNGQTRMSPIDMLSSMKWNGTVISVVGGFDKGKSMLLNKLVDGSFPSSCRVHTMGLSFKQLEYEKRNYILVDSAGKDSAFMVSHESDMSVNDSEAEDRFISDVVFEISDIFIFVVNEISGKEQREIHRLTQRLSRSNKRFKDLFVVVNLKHAKSEEDFEALVKQHISFYPEGQIQSQKVPGQNDYISYLSGGNMYQRHFFIAYEDSNMGRKINPPTYNYLRMALNLAVMTDNIPNFSAIESVKKAISTLLPAYTTAKDPIIELADVVESTEREKGQAKFVLANRPEGPIATRAFSQDTFSLAGSRNNLSENVPVYDTRQYQDNFAFYIEAPGAENIKIKANPVTSVLNVTYTVNDPNPDHIVEKKMSQRQYGNFSLDLTVPREFHYESRCRKESYNKGVIQITVERREEEEATTIPT